MNVTVFAASGEWLLFLFLLFLLFSQFSRRERRKFSSLMWFHRHCCACGFHLTVYGDACFFFLFSLARIAVIGFLENVVTNLHFSWLFVQLNVERIDFVFFAQSHSSVAPHPPSLPLLQVWPWLRSRSVRFTRNKLFFFSCKLTSLFLVLLI